MNTNKKDTLSSMMSETERQRLEEEPKAIRGLLHFMNNEDVGKNDTKETVARRKAIENTFKKPVENAIDNNAVMNRIIYYKRMGINKEIIPVYIDKGLKEKLDFLIKSPKYKGFSRTVILSAVLSLFLDNERDEIENEMKTALEILEKKVNNKQD